MEIREAVSEDAQDIYELYSEVMNYDYSVYKIKEMIDIVHRDDCHFVFVAIESNKVVGVIEVVIKYSIHKPSYLIINTLAVLLEYQRKGVGSQLLMYTEQFAKTKGLKSITFGSQFKRLSAHQFYINNGYKIMKEHKIFEKKI